MYFPPFFWEAKADTFISCTYLDHFVAHKSKQHTPHRNMTFQAPSAKTIAVLVVLWGLWILGLKYYIDQNSHDALAMEEGQMHQQNIDIQQLVADCTNDVSRQENLKEIDPLSVSEFNKYNDQVSEETMRSVDLSNQITQCQSELAEQMQRWSAEDRALAENISLLRREQEVIIDVVRSSAVQGTDQHLLIATLERLQHHVADLRQALNLDTIETDSEILLKHIDDGSMKLPYADLLNVVVSAGQENNSLKEQILQSALDSVEQNNERFGEQYQQLLRRYARLKQKTEAYSLVEEFDPEKTQEAWEKVYFFLPNESQFGAYPRPVWRGHRQSAEVKNGATPFATPPRAWTAQRIVRLTAVAQCAFVNDDENFMYPHAFLRRGVGLDDKVTLESLTQIIDTPLLSFCRNCVRPQLLKSFQLACNESQSVPYGSRIFWATRSRIRFPQVLQVAASLLANRMGLKTGKYLAVDFTRQVWREKKKQIPSAVWHLGTDRMNYGIEPISAIELQDAVNFRLKAASENNDPFTAVYFSCDSDRTAQMISALSFHGDPLIKYMAADSSEHDVIDMLIASSADGLILHPYSYHSQVVFETKMLRSRIRRRLDTISWL